jgi:hypothetical protein
MQGAAVRPYVPAVAPPPAGVFGRCRWCELSASEPDLGEPFVLIVQRASSPADTSGTAVGDTAGAAGASAWTLVPKRHVPVLMALPAAEIGSVLAGLVRASRELARLSGAADVQILPELAADSDSPGSAVLSAPLEASPSGCSGPSPRQSDGHVRFQLVPQFSADPGLPRLASLPG